jgi:hypothetical protein
MPQATIVRRSGRRNTEHVVELEKPPEAYAQSEELMVKINGRDMPVHVEIPIGKIANKLYVAYSRLPLIH